MNAKSHVVPKNNRAEVLKLFKGKQEIRTRSFEEPTGNLSKNLLEMLENHTLSVAA